jgi:hypothetical protein
VPLDKFADDIDRVEAATRSNIYPTPISPPNLSRAKFRCCASVDSDQTEADLNALAFQLNEVTAEVKQVHVLIL